MFTRRVRGDSKGQMCRIEGMGDEGGGDTERAELMGDQDGSSMRDVSCQTLGVSD